MSNRVVALLLVISVLVGVAAGAGATLLVAKQGPAGPAGDAGPRGPRGPAGTNHVSASEVLAAIEEDPGSVAIALSGYLDYEDIADNLDYAQIQAHLDPDPADVQSSLEDLCSELSYSSALSDLYLYC